MILFVSGRCDIPAYYSSWFFHRLQAGFVDVRNPFNPHSISRILLDQEHVDVIVFCTKNPIPMIDRLDEITLPYVFQITLTPYHQDVEKQVFHKDQIVAAIHALSERLGKKRVTVRYDPILLNDHYTIAYHIKAFTRLCEQLEGIVDTIIISFVDMYKNTKANADQLKLKELRDADMQEIGKAFGRIAAEHQFVVQTCAEKIDLSSYGVKQGACMNKKELVEAIGHDFPTPMGTGVRGKLCDCLASVDIGDYNCCAHECLYCYANYDAKQIKARMKEHDPQSSVLLGHLTEEDHITVRQEKRKLQMSFPL